MKRFKATHLYFTCLLLLSVFNGFAFAPPTAGPPEMIAVVKESNTSLRLHFNEIVTVAGTYNNEFSLMDCKGNSFAVSAIADDVANDMNILLTTDDLSTAQGDLTLTFFNLNNPLLDLDSNPLGTDGTGVELLSDLKYDVSEAMYESKFYTFTENSDPRAFTFNSDGTKLYMIGINTDASIYEYNLSAPYEVQSMTYSGASLSVGQSGAVTSPLHIEFTPDGSKLFVASFVQRAIVEYQLTSNWDITTASLVATHVNNLQITGFQFNDDGTKVYIMEISSDRIWEFPMTTPYDLSTRAFSQTGILNLSMSIPVSFDFNHDGTKLFALDRNIERVEQYTLAVPYELSTVSYDGTAERYSVSIVGQAGGLGFSGDGSEMYVIGTATNKSIFQFTLSDNDGPILSQALLRSSSEIDVLFDESVTISGASPSSFSVIGDGVPFTVDQALDSNPGDNAITLVMNPSPAPLTALTTSVTVQYDESGVNDDIADAVCNPLEDDLVGITLSLETQAPSLVTATIQDSQTILLTFDENVLTTGNNASNFTITDCRGTTYVAQSIKDDSPGDNQLELILDDLTYISGDLSIDYTDPGNQAIYDGSLNPLGNLTTSIPSSITDTTAPVMTDLFKNSPNEVTVVFSENVTAYEQFPTSFTVSDGSNLYSPNAVLDGIPGDNTIKLTFSGALLASSELTVTYNNTSGNNEISDFSCNNLATDPTGVTVSLETVPPVLRLIQVESSTELSLYFDEPVQLSSGISGANFVLSDCDATVFNTTAANDNITGDNIIVLTVDDISAANGELNLQVTTNNFEITDLSGNPITGNSVNFVLEDNYNMTNAVFKGESFTFSTEDTFPTALAFDGTGMNMFMAGNDNKTIHRYQLSAPYDVSTAVLSPDNLNVSSYVSTPLYIGFNPTGTRMYMVGIAAASTTTWVSQFDLSTAYDITTAVLAGSIDTDATQGEDIPVGLDFNADGSKLFIVGSRLDMVLEYDLSTNYDISSATYAGNSETLDISGPVNGSPVALAFDDSGLVLWILSNTSNVVVKYLLDTPFDVSTATFAGNTQSLGVSTIGGVRTFVFSDDGALAFLVGSTSSVVLTYELEDKRGPRLTDATLVNNTTIDLTFNEVVQAVGAFSGDFSVTDLAGAGSLFTVSSITDATPGDEILTLIVSDLSMAAGDIQITYDDVNNEISDFNCNDMAADPVGIFIDQDAIVPTMTTAEVDNATQISVTFSEPVQTNEGNPSDFAVTDGVGTSFSVTAQADGIALDDVIVLTVSDVSNASGDLVVTYTNNNQEVSDFGNNLLATDAQGVTIDYDQVDPVIDNISVSSGNDFLILTFTENVKANSSNQTSFTLVDGAGNSVGLSTLDDNTPLDNELELNLFDPLSGALGDVYLSFSNNTNIIEDFGGNFLQTTTSLIEVDIDQTAPTLVGVAKDSDTQLTLTFSEPVQTSGANASDFVVTDDQGTAIQVTAIADGTTEDTDLELTVSSLSVVNNDITVTYIGGNGVVSDFGSNDLATDNVGVSLDIVAPAAPSVTGITEDNGASGTDGITNDNTLIFQGTAESNSTVELFTDGISTITTTADGAGNFSFDFTGTTASDGTFSLTVTATDAAGNTSAASQPFVLTIDTNAPSVSALIRNQSGKLGSSVTSADFAIIFSEPVNGIDATDFEVVLTGTATGQVGTVTVVSVNEAIIEVTGISGEGTIGLNLKDDDSIEDTAGNVLGGAGTVNGDFTGEVYETKASQTITFTDPSGTYGDVITLSATASSSLTVSYALISGPASLSGDQLTITGVGAIEVEASQAGDADFNAATAVSKTFTPSKATLTATADDQTITFGDALPSFTISYSGFIGADAVADLDVVPNASSTATATSDAGTYPIIASGGNDGNYDFSYQAGTLTINQASQTITFDAIADIDLANTDMVSLVATASSGLAVDFILTQGDGSISGSTLTANATGIFMVEAIQAGNTNYAAATTVTQTFNVNDSRKTDQTITFDALTGKVYGDAAFSLSATASSSLPVTFTVAGPASLNGSDLTITGAGMVTVTASQAGDATYNPAPAVVQDFNVSTAALTVTANDKSNTYGDALPTLDGTITGIVSSDNITATYVTAAVQTSDAGIYAIAPTLVDPDGRLVNYSVTNNDGELTIAKADLSASANDKTIAFGEALPTFDGTLTGVVNSDNISVTYSTTAVVGSDVGDYDIDVVLVDPDSKLSNYNETIQIGVLSIIKADQTISFDPISDIDLATASTVNLVASASSSLDVVYTLTSGDGSITGNVLTVNATGNFTVEASQAGNTNFNAATSVTQSFQAIDSRKMDQTITFGSIADQEYGDVLTLGATASSNLAVTYTLTAGTGTIANGELTIEDVGSYTIVASQSGDNDFNPAADVTQSFTVTEADLTVTADDQMIDEGDEIPTLTFVYSGFKLSDDASVLDTAPTISTTATAQSTPGDYAITLTGGDDNHYTFTLVDGTLTIDEVLGLGDETMIQIYPNPAIERIVVSGDQVAGIQLIDLGGKTVMSANEKQLDLSLLSAGTYVVVVKNAEGAILAERRIIKE